ncbi:MAG: hypothetical protein AAFY69_03470 [Pseudomonadota bacterium]
MNDDDIPVLTKVVRRERRAHPTLTPDLRAAVVKDVTAHCRDAMADLIQAAAVDIDALLTDRVMAELMERLPNLVETALAECIAKQEAEHDEADG